MAENKRPAYLRDYYAAVIDNGYNIIPIQPGKKFPIGDDWQKIKATKPKVKGWLADGLTYISKDNGEEKTANVAYAGLGILTKHTPGVDIDISDEAMAKAMVDWVHERFGFAPVRVGRAPRALLMFRTDEPFHKVQSAVYLDEWDDPQKVEILGDGQQFVAFHVHPDTNKPYQWLYKDGPHLTEAGDLPTLTEDQAREIVKEFERRAKAANWKLKKSASRALAQRRNSDEDDPFADVKEKTRISDEELREKLALVPDNDDYEMWMSVGMALYHQYDGSDDGLELWHEWSESASNYDKAALDRHWPSFDSNEKGREPLTARFILARAKEAEAKIIREEVDAIVTAMKEADTRDLLMSACASAKKVDFDPVNREVVLGSVKAAWKRLTGDALSIARARDFIRYEDKNRNNAPEWAAPMVYLTQGDMFFNTSTKVRMTRAGLDAENNRFMMTKTERLEGAAKPEVTASDAVLNRWQCEVCFDTMYLPDADPVFTMNGQRWANSYTDRGVPDIPAKPTKAGRAAVALVKDHIEMLVPDERDRGLLISWMSSIARDRRRPNWSVMIQGAESNGKSVLGTIMGLVMGPENVKVLDPVTIQESAFTDWAAGACLGVIEEMKIEGGSRFDVLNKIKTKITNPIIEIHPKGRAAYNVVNTMAYLILTNYKDAMPIKKGNTRFFPIYTALQSEAEVRTFNMRNPNYFNELFDAIEAHPGAIRQWLIEYEPHPEFDRKRRAPISKARDEMMNLSKSNEAEVLDDLLSERPREDMSETLLNASAVAEEVVGIAGVASAVVDQRLKRELIDRGYTYLGRFMIDGVRSRYWSTRPEKFIRGGKPDAELIREWADDL